MTPTERALFESSKSLLRDRNRRAAKPDSSVKLRRWKRLLLDLHPHILALSVSDDDPKMKALLVRVEKELF